MFITKTFLKKRLKPLFNVAAMLLILSIILIGWRDYQIRKNKEILKYNLDWSSSPLNINVYQTHHVAFIQNFLNHDNWPKIFNAQHENIDKYKLLKLFSNYKLYQYDDKYLRKLIGSNNSSDYEVVHWYMNQEMIPDMKDYFENKNFEMARYIAQRYINLTKKLPPSYFFNEINYQLSLVNFIKEYQYNRFPFLEKEISEIVAYKEISKLDISTNEKQDKWKEYLKNYPESIKYDDAEANIIYYMMNNTDLNNKNNLETVISLLEKSGSLGSPVVLHIFRSKTVWKAMLKIHKQLISMYFMFHFFGEQKTNHGRS